MGRRQRHAVAALRHLSKATAASDQAAIHADVRLSYQSPPVSLSNESRAATVGHVGYQARPCSTTKRLWPPTEPVDGSCLVVGRAHRAGSSEKAVPSRDPPGQCGAQGHLNEDQEGRLDVLEAVPRGAGTDNRHLSRD